MTAEGRAETAGNRRERLRAELLADTHAAAWRIADSEGIQGLTMTAVAREVGVSPPALYRYFEGRDGLLHALHREAMASLVEHVIEAAERQEPDDVSAQLHMASRAVFDWSVTNKAAFDLLMGSAYPAAARSGHDVPHAVASELGGLFRKPFGRLWESGRLVYPQESGLPPLRPQLEAYRAAVCPDLPLGVAYLMFTCWRQIYGMTCMAVYHHLGFAVTDPGLLRGDDRPVAGSPWPRGQRQAQVTEDARARTRYSPNGRQPARPTAPASRSDGIVGRSVHSSGRRAPRLAAIRSASVRASVRRVPAKRNSRSPVHSSASSRLACRLTPSGTDGVKRQAKRSPSRPVTERATRDAPQTTARRRPVQGAADAPLRMRELQSCFRPVRPSVWRRAVRPEAP
ncbi:TetR family transcriptional regulator [Streptomyces sp. INA 01156]